MYKKPSFYWSFVIGAVFTILQVLIYILRFSTMNANAPISDYISFFIGGSIIGLGLIYFVRRSDRRDVFRATLIGFAMGTPLALMGMMLGGLAGPIGVVFLGVSPGIFSTGVGYYLGRLFSKKKPAAENKSA